MQCDAVDKLSKAKVYFVSFSMSMAYADGYTKKANAAYTDIANFGNVKFYQSSATASTPSYSEISSSTDNGHAMKVRANDEYLGGTTGYYKASTTMLAKVGNGPQVFNFDSAVGTHAELAALTKTTYAAAVKKMFITDS